jgi:thiamine-phosphate pyrophosphorylase
MIKNLQNISFYFVTDNEISDKDEITQVKEALRGGANIIQYRDKNSSKEILLQTASKLKEICDEENAIFIINDYVDIAYAVDADGVHIGQDDMAYEQARSLIKDKIIGVTVHNVEEAIKAERMGADYLGASPIFSTNTKKDAGKAMGLELLKEIKKSVNIPIVAIGGINIDNVDSVIKAGADSVCAISATVIGDTANNVKIFVNKLKMKGNEYEGKEKIPR